MIIHALNDYYNRLLDSVGTDIPARGFSSQKIHFALVINQQGKLVQIRDTRETYGKKLLPKPLNVPEAVIRTSSKIAANFMWDNTGYVLGGDSGKDTKNLLKKFTAFKKLHHEIGASVDDEGIKAVLNFLDTWKPEEASGLQHWEDIAGNNVVFKLDSELRYIHERPKIRETWLNYLNGNISGNIATCLVCGKRSPIARLHPPIKGVRPHQPRGRALVSFNLDAFKSYGKDQNFNSPVSEDIAFAYTTALNYLLRNESRQKVQIGDAATVFWAERETPLENYFESIWKGIEIESDAADESGSVKDIRDFLEAARDGKKLPGIDDANIRFYILGLSPNAARLSVRFWHVSTVEDVSYKVGQHFKDLSIMKSFDNEPEYPSMRQLLRETAVRQETKNISPVLAGAMMRSILTGAAYPQSLLSAVIARIIAEQSLKNDKGKPVPNVNYLRASIIKACLNRKYRVNNKSMEVTMALNKDETNSAYRLGRLFAVLEKAQKDAIPGANTTIKDRYYGSASATPKTVFPQLIRLAQYHIQKAPYGRKLDKNVEDIMCGIKEFPSHLSLDEQGLFALGYYHQRCDLHSKPTEKKEEQL